MEKIKKYMGLTFRPELITDNVNKTMVLNRFLGNPLMVIIYILIINIIITFAFSFVLNVLSNIPLMIKDINNIDKYINISQAIPRIGVSKERKIIYIFFFIVLLILDIRKAYLLRISYSEKDINKGHQGTRRWTTLKEIDMQYKEIELMPSTYELVDIKDIFESEYDKLPKEGGSYVDGYIFDEDGAVIKEKIKTPNWYKGKGGIPVTRWKDKIYIDSQLTNNLFIGTTRSGKGEMFVFSLIDILSRAYKKADRPSMIIFDPKLELYKSSKNTLEKRGYITRLLNLDNPKKSAGYNPLAIITEYYAEGKLDEAQQLAKSFSFSIFNSSNDMQEKIWKNTATDLFTALILAVCSDCISMDEELNSKRREKLRQMKENFDYFDDKDEARERFYQIKNNLSENKDLISDSKELGLNYAPPEYEFKSIYPNRKNINCFSVINFFRELCDVNSGSIGEDPKAGEKKAETALDDYFNARPMLDYARGLYASIKTAGDRTKGSIYVNMQSALTIFSMDSIARMTAENNIDFKEIGFGDEPIAVFIGLPTEDKSNHFLAINFVTQVFQYLFKLAKARKGTLSRNVRFIFDEFGNMPVLDNFGGMVTNCLGVGFSFDVFIQSYDQLRTNYEMEMNTIKDNFANQIYILASGKETPAEFSEQLGNKTVIEVQRTGTRFAKNKTFMESNREKPLLFPEELQDFREGECAIIRASKRKDRSGAAIRSYPILCEYMKRPYFWWYIVAFVRLLKNRSAKGAMLDKDTEEALTFIEEYRANMSSIKRKLGTALLYRWEYATDDFPNPTSIKLEDICTESRASINYASMVYDTNKVIRKLGIWIDDKETETKTLGDLQGAYYAFDNKLSGKVENYKEEFSLYPETDINEAMRIIREIQNKYSLSEDFISTLETIIMQG